MNTGGTLLLESPAGDSPDPERLICSALNDSGEEQVIDMSGFDTTGVPRNFGNITIVMVGNMEATVLPLYSMAAQTELVKKEYQQVVQFALKNRRSRASNFFIQWLTMLNEQQIKTLMESCVMRVQNFTKYPANWSLLAAKLD